MLFPLASFQPREPLNVVSFSLLFHLGNFNSKVGPKHKNFVVGIFQVGSGRNGKCDYNRFTISSIGMDLAVQIFDPSQPFCSDEISQQKNEIIFRNFWTTSVDGWNFAALVYDHEKSQLAAYDGNGLFDVISNVVIEPTTTELFSFGKANRNGKNVFLPSHFSLSCFSFHNSVLTWIEILQIRCICNRELDRN